MVVCLRIGVGSVLYSGDLHSKGCLVGGGHGILPTRADLDYPPNDLGIDLSKLLLDPFGMHGFHCHGQSVPTFLLLLGLESTVLCFSLFTG
uniref:Uncharacterized protein n=1 Tax=Fagus sylvatica TaxID=28930 RepID=A0A2N9HT79_FAGSY